MLRTFPCALVLLLAGAAAVASAQQSTSHYGGGSSSRIGAISLYNPTTKHYEPVTWDKQYTYYRLKFRLAITFTDNFQPDPAGPSVISTVVSGDVYDSSSNAKVGTWDSSIITTVFKSQTQELQQLSTLALELGPNSDDAIFISAAFDVVIVNQGPSTQAPTDHDSAVTGGTGRYKGATGEMQLSEPNDPLGTQTTFVAELAVPRFKRW